MMGGTARMPFLPPRNLDNSGFRNGHGLIGDVLSLSENSLVVKDPSGKENIISLDSKTLIRNGGNNLSIADLQAGDKVAVIGSPGDNGTVHADFIRILGKN
jgi:hypothetical protein